MWYFFGKLLGSIIVGLFALFLAYQSTKKKKKSAIIALIVFLVITAFNFVVFPFMQGFNDALFSNETAQTLEAQSAEETEEPTKVAQTLKGAVGDVKFEISHTYTKKDSASTKEQQKKDGFNDFSDVSYYDVTYTDYANNLGVGYIRTDYKNSDVQTFAESLDGEILNTVKIGKTKGKIIRIDRGDELHECVLAFIHNGKCYIFDMLSNDDTPEYDLETIADTIKFTK